MRDRFPWLLALIYALVFTWLGAIRYSVHRNFVDFGIFAQTIASAFGCFCNPIEGSHWAFHFSPILYSAGAVVALWHSPLALVAMSALGGALTIPPVYALIAARAPGSAARLSALVAFLYPPLAGLAFNDFHENALAPAAVLWAIWAFDARRTALAVVLALVAMCVKEDQAIFIAIAAAIVAWRFEGVRRRAGIGVAVCGVAIVVLYFTVVQPHAQANPNWAPVRFYAWNQSDLVSLPSGLLQRAGFLVLIFLPLAFMPFRSLALVLAAAPLAEVLLSRMSTTYTTGSHYAGAWIGYVLAAFAFAIRDDGTRHRRALLASCLAICVLELAVANPMHPGLNLRFVEPRDRELDATLASLPREIDVATQEEAYTHLALDDPHADVLPEEATRPVHSCYVLIDSSFPDSPRLMEYGKAFAALVARGAYVKDRANGTVALYRSDRCLR